jgi:hypothetical protein
MLHVSASIQRNGPCWVTWQFPIERVFGMLLPLTRSRLHPYKNLINNVYFIELFNHLQFYKTIQQIIFSPMAIKDSKQHTFSAEGYEESFLTPMMQYTLSKAEIRKIKQHYITNYVVKAQQLQVCICLL